VIDKLPAASGIGSCSYGRLNRRRAGNPKDSCSRTGIGLFSLHPVGKQMVTGNPPPHTDLYIIKNIKTFAYFFEKNN